VRKHASVEIFGKSAVLNPTSMIAMDGFEFFNTIGVGVTDGVAEADGVGGGDATTTTGFEVGVALGVGEAVTGIGLAVATTVPGTGTNGFDMTGVGVGVAVFAVVAGVKPAKAPVGKRTLVTTHKPMNTRIVFFMKSTLLLLTDILASLLD
jgi:hypothetical protein